MEPSHIAILAVVLLVAAIGAFVIIAAPNSTGMAMTNANPYKCTSWGGYWYSPYGCSMTPELCSNAGGTWRTVNRQCVGYDEAELCGMVGSTWDGERELCRY